ncbi:hypothetical protein Tco_1304051 [Tanacetum coccineum]
MPHDSPLPRVHSLGSDENSMTLHELTVLCTTLSKKVESLESDLKHTKLTYGAAYTKLIINVKKLENIIKSSKARRRVRLIVSEDEGDLEDPSKQGRKIAQLDEDEGITLPDISTANVPVSTVSAEVSAVSPEVKTAAESLVYIRRSVAKRKDKGKAIIKEAEHVQKKTKLQLKKERLGQKTNEEQSAEEEKELSEEELQKLMMIVPMEKVYVEALQVKYPIIDCEFYSKDRQESMENYQRWNPYRSLTRLNADMLKKFIRDDLDKL